MSDIVTEDGVINLNVVVTPYKFKALAKIEVHLYEEGTNREVMAIVQLVSYEAYKQVEKGIEETIKDYIRQIHSNKVYDEHNIPKIEKRTMYFNGGEYKVVVENKEYYTAVNYIIVYHNGKEEFKVPVPQLNFYERAEVLKAVADLFGEKRINVRMDSEESEYTHGTFGPFIVKPLGNNSIEVSKQGVINISKQYNVSYNNYNGIVQCINDVVQKLNTNVMKYADKELAGDINFKQKERDKELRRREEAQGRDRGTNTKTQLNNQPTIKGLFDRFSRK
ncbi:MAG: hypothetical protein NC548_55020 [Lachnospiraceae bacterium]|nr:hypothetical protein [Lachnospiraceae bacterium]